MKTLKYKLSSIITLLLFTLPFQGSTEELDPAIYLLVDTSGSMLMTIDGSQNTYGDGSAEHPEATGLTSRFSTAKDAIRQILNSYGEVRWGLARFEQNSGFNYLCMCHDEIPNNTSGCGGYGGLYAPEDDCRLCDMYSDYPDYDLEGTHDRVCINYAGGVLDGCLDPITNAPLTGADILVPLGDNTRSSVALWVNNSETDEGETGYNGSLTPEEQPDPELRANGGTPIGGSLQDIYDQLANHDIGNDNLRGCRPYSIIVLTDGAESCNTDPVTVATNLLSVPDNLHTCTNNSDCPTNSTCGGSGHCVYEVKTYVIAFAVAANEFVNCNDIAVAGNTGGAISAQNTSELVSAMAGIIADSIRTELCNGIDDDCDGSVDEDYPELGATCDNGQLGVCKGTGTYICMADETGTTCNITSPGIAASGEVCDGLDNDCNGLVDDGISCSGPTPELCNGTDDDGDGSLADDGDDDPRVNQPCGSSLGICQPGTTICQAGAIVCNTTQGPETEICDNLDNDCNGLTDDGLTDTCDATNASGSCSGLAYCSAGSWICTARTPEDETCNNFDDNCDGNIDEGLTRSCNISNAYGICLGSETCSTGTWAGCDAATPSLDICDGVDNDCDGDTDDSDPSVGQACQGGCGIYVCENGVLTCTGETGTTETCNALDDDCDGLIDEDLQQECEISNEFGTCLGFEICSNGMWGGCSASTPAQEDCNGLDDNCDGVIDENAVCPNPDNICYEGVCRSRCTVGEFSCEPTDECVEYPEDDTISICLPILQECGSTICNTSQVCVSEECIDPCDPNPCDDLEECVANYRWKEGEPVDSQYICKNVSCFTLGNGCSAGEFCSEGYCIEDPCTTTDCEDLEYCERTLQDATWVGVCKSVCACGEGQRCNSDGECENDPCYNVNCSGLSETCVEGECVTDDCLNVYCETGEICNGGSCVFDPCSDLKCPSYATCEVVSDGHDGILGVCRPKDGNYTEQKVTGSMTAGGFGCSTNKNSSDSGTSSFIFMLLGTLLWGTFRKRNIKMSILSLKKKVTPLFALAIIFSVTTACDRAVYEVKTDGGININNQNNTNNSNNSNNTNNINNSNNNCTPEDEICDDKDNDCNGIVDDYWTAVSEGGEGHFSDDPANCGSCNNICAFYHGVASCENGQCVLSGCQPYHFDNNNDPTDGCEYQCNTMGDSTEICDGLDNDCDGISDEYWIPVADGGEGHFEDDPENCGFCGVSCNGLYDHGVGDCNAGLCELSGCEAGWINANGFMSDGCETQCVETNGGVEICDGIDNDCNGITDDATNGDPLSRSCYSGPNGTENVGTCHGGIQYCESGTWDLVCVGETTPVTEQCNLLDDDCDNVDDNGFDTTSDINNCGGCGNSCLTNLPAHAYPTGCSASTCQYNCEYGYHDINNDLNLGSAGDGCEYACEPTASAGTEYCDGIDNDCDNQIDEAGDLVAAVPGYCRTGGLCGTTVSTSCQFFAGTGKVEWVCNYPAGVERISGSPNLVVGYETVCDGLDGDCDGTADDDFYPALGAACEDSNPGICKGTGTYVCKSDHSGTECNITTGGMGLATSETCNNIDDDCDGLVDEPSWNPGTNPSYVQNDTTYISVAGKTVKVFTYEASRPTATSGDAGSGSNYPACSKPSVLPWSKVTYEQARQACQAAGMNLCSDTQWKEACDGSGSTWEYPYSSSTYSGSACNGEDAGHGTAQITGSMPNCSSNGYGIEDLSGNLREWTDSVISYNDEGKVIYKLKGGSYRDTSESLKCDYEYVGLVEDAFADNVGFRCCSTCGDGVVDTNELCDDGNIVSGDGCNGVCAPDTCGNGVVDGIEECDCGLNASSLPAGCISINGASDSNCSVNCIIPEERCSVLYPGDQDKGSESNDCTDPDCNGTWCADVSDNDNDGFAEPDDCNDNNPAINPAADEVCGNGVDDNCNGFIDDAEPDKDGDGSMRCVSGVTTDCDDWNENRSPDIPEICGDGIDNNCDGNVDTGCASECEIAAYNRSYLGCEYYGTTTMNSLLGTSFNNDFGYVIYNPNSTAVTVTISKGGSILFNQSIAADSVQNVLLAFDNTLRTTNSSIQTITNGAFKIVSTLPVAVYQFSPFDFRIGGNYSYTNDASLLIPKHALTNSYLINTQATFWSSSPGFMTVVATSDNTQVRITFNGHAQGGPDRGQQQTYNLSDGDVLQIPSRQGCADIGEHFCSSDYDFTGSLVEVLSGDPVAVYAGHDCIYLPGSYSACDHLEEQMMPLETWGQNYIATYTAAYSGTTTVMNRYRILASENGTTVTFSPSSVHSSWSGNAGDYVEFDSDVNFTINSDHPISVMEYLLGQQYFSSSTGDPAMGLLVPMEQFRKDYSFSVPSSMTNNYVTIIKPVAQTGLNAPTVYINGTAIAESSFSTAIGSSYHGVARINLNNYPGVYSFKLTSTQPFGIMVYGNASYTSYFYPGGLDLNIINSAD